MVARKLTIPSEIVRIRETICKVEELVVGGKSPDPKKGDDTLAAVLLNGAVHQPEPATG